MTTGGLSTGLELNGSAAEARTQILGLLSSWSGLVAHERHFSPPARRPLALADFLLVNVGWLVAHPAVGDLSAEVATVVRMARRAAHPDPVKRVELGPCVAPGCEGRISASVRASRAGEGVQVSCCADSDHRWAGHEWTRLRRELQTSPQAAEERWLTAVDIAWLWATPTGTIYRLASQHGWRRISRAGHTYYAESDVHECFTHRKLRVLKKG